MQGLPEERSPGEALPWPEQRLSRRGGRMSRLDSAHLEPEHQREQHQEMRAPSARSVRSTKGTCRGGNCVWEVLLGGFYKT